MIVFIYGQDTYRSSREMRDIAENYKKSHPGAYLKLFDEDNFKPEAVLDEIQQPLLFGGNKLVILKNVSFNKDDKVGDLIAKIVKKTKDTDDLIFIYEEKEIGENSSLFKVLAKSAECKNFEPLDGAQLRKWLIKEFVRLKVGIAADAVENLINSVGNDLWRLSNEAEKLANFRRGAKIKSEDVKLLVRPKIENDIFKTIDALAIQDKKKALFLIHRHLEKGDSPLYLLAMINFQFRNLLAVKDLLEKKQPYYAIAKIANLHPFVARKSCQQADQFTLSDLKKIYQKIFQADLDIKTGKVSQEAALDLLITGL